MAVAAAVERVGQPCIALVVGQQARQDRRMMRLLAVIVVRRHAVFNPAVAPSFPGARVARGRPG
jgi:hypothetical protein